MVWQHLRDQSGNKMESAAKKRPHHDLYVQRALKKAAQNENFNARDSTFISTSTRDQVLLMYRAAQKNKTKAGQMLVGKSRKDHVTYYPGMLQGKKPDYSGCDIITDYEDDEEENLNDNSVSETSTAAYQKMHVEPLAQSSRNVSRTSNSWQPLSMTALQEYSPQITVSTKPNTEEEKMWKVL